MGHNTKNEYIDIEVYPLFKKIFCYTLASRNFIRKEIDIIFDRDKLKFLNAFKNSDIRNSNISKSYDVETEIYTQKIIGILEYDILKNNFNNINSLYSKAFNKIYRNLKDKKNISISDITPLLENNDEYTFVLVTTIFFFDSNDYIYIKNNNENDFLSTLISETYKLENYIDLNYSNDFLKDSKKDLDYFKNKLNLKNKEYTLNEILKPIIAIDLYKSGYLNDINNLKNIQNNDGFEIIKRKGDYSKFIGANQDYLKYLGYDVSKFHKIKITKFELNQLLMNLCLSKKNSNFSDDDCVVYFINIVYSMSLNKEYRNTRKEYVKFINEENILAINEIQSNLKNTKIELQNLKSQLEIKEKKITYSNKELLAQLEQLKKENQRLKERVLESESLKNEVIKLRNLSFTMSNEAEQKNNEFKYDTDRLNALNLAIVGGTNTWINKMKEKLPNAKFITNDNKNINFKFLKNIDMVFINIKMPHSLYFKVKSTIDKFDIKYDFIDSKENIEYSLIDLYEKVKGD